MVNPRKTVLSVFHAYSPPDVPVIFREPEFGIQEGLQPIGSLGQNLVGVPVSLDHNPDDILYIRIGHIILEQVAHAVHEDGTGARPLKGLDQFLGNEAKIEALPVWMSLNPTKPLSESLCVAVLAAWTDFSATAKGIPSRVGPLDFRMVAHRLALALTFRTLFILSVESGK
jgi:hypothetical protein